MIPVKLLRSSCWPLYTFVNKASSVLMKLSYLSEEMDGLPPTTNIFCIGQLQWRRGEIAKRVHTREDASMWEWCSVLGSATWLLRASAGTRACHHLPHGIALPGVLGRTTAVVNAWAMLAPSGLSPVSLITPQKKIPLFFFFLPFPLASWI